MIGEESIPYLGEDDLDRISKLLDAYESGRFNTSVQPTARPRLPPLETKVGRATTDIPAMGQAFGSGSFSNTLEGFPGSGLVDIYYLDWLGTFAMLAGPETGITVWNIYPTKILKDDWVILCREPVSGQYFVASTYAHIAGSTSGSTGSGNSVQVITDAHCDSGGLWVTSGLLRGTVNIGGTSYPVSFTIGGASGG